MSTDKKEKNSGVFGSISRAISKPIRAYQEYQRIDSENAYKARKKRLEIEDNQRKKPTPQPLSSPSRSQILKDKEVQLQKALSSSPIDKALIERGRQLNREAQSNKSRGTQSSTTRKLIK
jgi:hypothetical protein